MVLRAWNVVVLAAVSGLWLASGTQREKPVLEETPTALQPLEAKVAAHPTDALATRELAQEYLDARSPGLALSVVERAPSNVRHAPQVEHVYARALLDQGRANEALLAERSVLAQCAGDGACDAWLVASATRRADILQELVQLGIEDAQAHPEASAIAYHNATREARLALQ
jgi:predicted Zn-dependent protease